MKTYKLLLACAFCLMTAMLFGQREETLFGRTGGLTGAWGAPVYNYAQFGEDWVYIRGGYGGLEFGRTLFLGWGGFKTRENVNIEGVDPFRFRYGGFILGVAPNSYRSLHARFNLLTGGGRLDMADGERDRVFVMQPSAGVEVNIFQWMRLGLEGGYRFVMDSDVPALNTADLSAPFFQIDLRFGFSWD